MATLEQIQARMKKLQAQAETLLAKRAQAAVDQIRELMIKHGLTTADIEARAKARRDAKFGGRRLSNGSAKLATGAKGKMPPKYRDPKTGATWSGHARPPAWIKDVKDRTRFLIDGAAAVALNGSGVSKKTTASGKAAAKKATGRKAAAKKVVAKKTATKTAASRKIATKKTAAKKVAAKKVTAKKVTAKKAAASKTAASKAPTAKRAYVRKAVAKTAAPGAAA
ncbi:H-NS histone family protein [Paraburkholderia sp. BCC1885]|uniref:H-NS histone family protein n=1 Tax=Paraburkholderia sp. BCC1885 TaxID=2562669 RepID=UPI001181FC95|nr:H-NS histone family protein [Paraburkholderia sp. BCC1885]